MILLSLGAGVQSSTMALMAAFGEITPMPDAAVFADTHWEPKHVYKHLDWLESQLPFPVYRVSSGNLRDDAIRGTVKRSTGMKLFSAIPWFLPDGGMGKRQCTYDYKIQPIYKKSRLLLGYKPRQRIPVGSLKLMMGISTDEASRMKPSKERWIENVWPLIDKGLSRSDCISWFQRRYPGRAIAKSACIGCPFHNDALWRDMKINDPDSFSDAVYVDSMIRTQDREQYMHPQRIPLDEVDLRNLEDKGQLNMFNNECEGMCGV